MGCHSLCWKGCPSSTHPHSSPLHSHLTHPPTHPAQTLTGKEIEIDIEPADSVARIKERVEEKEGIPPAQQRWACSPSPEARAHPLIQANPQPTHPRPTHGRLIFGGKQMNDERVAVEYGVEGGSVLHLVLALRGGRARS